MPREPARIVITDAGPTEPIRLSLCRGPHCDTAEIDPLRALALSEELIAAARARLAVAGASNAKAGGLEPSPLGRTTARLAALERGSGDG
jgi:hypothetical protein